MPVPVNQPFFVNCICLTALLTNETLTTERNKVLQLDGRNLVYNASSNAADEIENFLSEATLVIGEKIARV